MLALRLLGAVPPWRRPKRARLTRSSVDLSVRAAGLSLPNPIGLGAGLDKNAEAIPGLFALGFGAVEVGTVTPRAQPGNPKPRLFRITSHHALINRMGFNNRGAEDAARRLTTNRWRPGPIGANIGKNRDTPLDRSVDDYLRCVDLLAPVSDYLAINVSSPNTPNLRELQEAERLSELLEAVGQRLDRARPVPIFLKIAPDLADSALDELVDVALAHRVSA